MAAKYVEGTIGSANSFTGEMAFIGRVSALVDVTSPPWSGTVVLQRRYKKPDGSWSAWMIVASLTEASVNSFVEHEADVQYRLGTVGGLTGGTPLARLSQ